jgi:hypothetical protein
VAVAAAVVTVAAVVAATAVVVAATAATTPNSFLNQILKGRGAIPPAFWLYHTDQSTLCQFVNLKILQLKS